MSTTEMVWTAETELPQVSVAVQVRVITDDCGQLPAAAESANVTVGVASQPPVAMASPVPAGLLSASHSIVT